MACKRSAVRSRLAPPPRSRPPSRAKLGGALNRSPLIPLDPPRQGCRQFTTDETLASCKAGRVCCVIATEFACGVPAVLGSHPKRKRALRIAFGPLRGALGRAA